MGKPPILKQLREWLCGTPVEGGHFYLDGTCIHCRKKEESDGNRADSPHHQSIAGAFPAARGSAAGANLQALYAKYFAMAGTVGGTGGSAAHPGVAEPLETVATEVLAERAWHLSQDAQGAPILKSIVYAFPWDGPTLVARPGPPDHTSTHGIYAQKSLDDCYKAYAVWGEVALSGVVVEGERGYRAERATIRKLHLRYLPATTPTRNLSGFVQALILPSHNLVWPKPWDVAADLAERYACECDLDWLS